MAARQYPANPRSMGRSADDAETYVLARPGVESFDATSVNSVACSSPCGRSQLWTGSPALEVLRHDETAILWRLSERMTHTPLRSAAPSDAPGSTPLCAIAALGVRLPRGMVACRACVIPSRRSTVTRVVNHRNHAATCVRSGGVPCDSAVISTFSNSTAR